MKDRSTRRKFLATLGTAGTITFAGCSALPGGSSPSNTTTTTTSNASTPKGTSTKSPKTTIKGNGGNSTKGNGGKNNKKNKNVPFTRGKVIEAFEGDVQSRLLAPDYGSYKVTTKDVYQGSQSLVLQPLKPSKRQKSLNRPYARINLFFKQPLDLSNKDLTMAVKVDKPKAIDVVAKLFAPTSNVSLLSSRRIKKDMNEWVRYDLGYTSKSGKPDLSKVLKIQIILTVPPGGPKDFKVKIDDLRAIPKAKKGKVIIQFDDGHISAFKNAYPLLKQKGWPASCAVIPDIIGANHRVTRRQMQKMSEDGWDMMSHPDVPPETGLPGLPKKIQRRKIKQAHRKLVALGFKKGARHLVAPYNRLSGETIDILRDVHDTAFLFGACPNNGNHTSNPYYMSRVQGSSLRGTKEIVDMAAKFNQMAVVSWHVIGKYKQYPNAPSEKYFKDFLNFVEKKNVDVITPSQLIDGKNW